MPALGRRLESVHLPNGLNLAGPESFAPFVPPHRESVGTSIEASANRIEVFVPRVDKKIRIISALSRRNPPEGRHGAFGAQERLWPWADWERKQRELAAFITNLFAAPPVAGTTEPGAKRPGISFLFNFPSNSAQFQITHAVYKNSQNIGIKFRV